MNKITVQLQDDFYQKLATAAKKQDKKVSTLARELLSLGYDVAQELQGTEDESSSSSTEKISALTPIEQKKLDLMMMLGYESSAMLKQLLTEKNQSDFVKSTQKKAKLFLEEFHRHFETEAD